MARAQQRKLPSVGGRTQVERLEIEQFARRLNERMNELDLSASDVARAVWGTVTDKRGYTVAKNRDRIRVYLSGHGWPDPRNLPKLAAALKMKPEELAPDLAAATVERENPELALTAVGGHADQVMLRVNKLLPLSLAAQIVALVSAHEDERKKEMEKVS